MNLLAFQPPCGPAVTLERVHMSTRSQYPKCGERMDVRLRSGQRRPTSPRAGPMNHALHSMLIVACWWHIPVCVPTTCRCQVCSSVPSIGLPCKRMRMRHEFFVLSAESAYISSKLHIRLVSGVAKRADVECHPPSINSRLRRKSRRRLPGRWKASWPRCEPLDPSLCDETSSVLKLRALYFPHCLRLVIKSFPS